MTFGISIVDVPVSVVVLAVATNLTPDALRIRSALRVSAVQQPIQVVVFAVLAVLEGRRGVVVVANSVIVVANGVIVTNGVVVITDSVVIADGVIVVADGVVVTNGIIVVANGVVITNRIIVVKAAWFFWRARTGTR